MNFGEEKVFLWQPKVGQDVCREKKSGKNFWRNCGNLRADIIAMTDEKNA